MSKWKCEICGAEFENFHAQGFDNKIYCPLCYLKKENQELKEQLEEYKEAISFQKRLSKKYEEDATNCEKKLEDLRKIIKDSGKLFEYKKNKVTEQQKEFIEWLEKEIEALEFCDNEFILSNHKKEVKAYKEILLKYKEIIGKNINVSTREIKNDN